MPQPSGRKIALSLPRRLACDLTHFAERIPSVPVQRRMNVAALVGARAVAQPRPSWCAIFAKAFGMVAATRAELRRAFLSFPWSHLYEHPVNVAAIAVERRLGDEEVVLLAHLDSPEQQALVQLDERLLLGTVEVRKQDHLFISQPSLHGNGSDIHGMFVKM